MSRWAEFGFPDIIGYDRMTLLRGLQLAFSERCLAVGMEPVYEMIFNNATLIPVDGRSIHMQLIQFDNALGYFLHYAGQKYPELCVSADGQLITQPSYINTSGINLGTVINNQLKEQYVNVAWSREYLYQRYKVINLMRYKEFFNFKSWIKHANNDWFSGNVNGYLKNYHEDNDSGVGISHREYAVADADSLAPVWLAYTFNNWPSYFDLDTPPNLPPGNSYVFGNQLGNPDYIPKEKSGYAIQFRLCRDIRPQLEFYDEVFGDVLQY